MHQFTRSCWSYPPSPGPRGQEVFAVLGERLEPTLEDLDRLPHLRACLLPRGPHPAPPPLAGDHLSDEADPVRR